MKRRNAGCRRHYRWGRSGQSLRLSACLACVFLLGLFAPGLRSYGAVPGAEKLLPEETLLMVTAPDFAKLSALWQRSPQFQLWNDPAMKPFRDGFLAKWQDELVKPLERDLGVNLGSYTNWLRGQVTFAVVQDNSPGQEAHPLGLLLLADSKDKGDELKKTLADLRKKWVEAGRKCKTESVRNVELSVLSFSASELPKPLQRFLPQPPRFQAVNQPDPAPAEAGTDKPAPRSEVIVGQVGSLLIAGNSMKVVEMVVARLTGGNAPALGELAAYQVNDQAMFRAAPLYGWLNARALLDTLSRSSAEKSESDTPSPFDAFRPEKLLSALGLGALNAMAFTVQDSNDGLLLQVFFGAPEAKRRGLCKLCVPEAKDSSPPPFVPADTAKFVRWRSDGPKAWATLEKMLGDLSPQMLGGVNFLLDSAEASAKEKEPGLDLRKLLVGNLGDDLIRFEKAPRGSTPAELQSPPSLTLIGSPNPASLAAALKALLVIFPQGDTIAEREFLGRKVFSVPLPGLLLAVPGASSPPGQAMLNVAASGGYVAISTDTSMLEEYLRSSDSQAKVLRETAGLSEAAQKAGGMGTGWFGYENQAETMRATFEAWRKNTGSSPPPPSANPLAGMLTAPASVKSVEDWMDFSLLPPYETVSKYFSFTVYAVSANVDGLTFKMFAPVPSALRK